MSRERKTGTGGAGAAAKRRILIVEDHQVTRDGIALHIDSQGDMAVCGQAGDAAEAVEAVAKLKPDLVLMDISLKGRSGLSALEEIHRRWPVLPAVVFSMHSESLYGVKAMEAGARGYVNKDAGAADVLAAIRTVLDGGTWFNGEVVSKAVQEFSAPRHARREPGLRSLSVRELEIYEMLGQGMSRREVGTVLSLSRKTVDSYVSRIMGKLKCETSAELLRHAVLSAEHGFPQDP